MKKKNQLSEIAKKVNSIKETDTGKLNGGFIVISSPYADFEEGTNNCNCKNKNRGRTCQGCESEALA